MSARLYLITPPAFDPAAFAPRLAEALAAGGVACVRLDLAGCEAEIRAAAAALAPVCARADAPLVLAEHPRLAAELRLDGVHLRDGGVSAIRAARALFGEGGVVGAFAGTSRHRAMVAGEAGADYVAFGPVRAGALGDGTEADPDLFAWWAELMEPPCVAEGGLTPAIAATLGAHADFLAPRSGVWTHPEGPAAGVRAFRSALG